MSLRQMLVMDITDLCDDLLSSIQMNIITNNRSTQTNVYGVQPAKINIWQGFG